jgi:hypothetical protein
LCAGWYSIGRTLSPLLVFATLDDQRKLRNLRRDPRVALALQSDHVNEWGLVAATPSHSCSIWPTGSPDVCASVRRVTLSRNVLALAVALVVNVLLVILLTPLGFESRPATDLKTVGYIAIGTIFAGLALDLASIVLLFRRVRLASSLAIVGSILFFFPIFGDRIGSFFSLPVPPVINILEYVLFVVLLVILFLASKVYRESNPSPS